MEKIGQYLLSVTAAVMITSILRRFFSGKGSAGAMLQMLSGIFMLYTVLMPFSHLSIPKFDTITKDFRHEAQQAVADGENLGTSTLRSIISDRVSAYILDKAKIYDAQLTVTVMLSQDAIPVPNGVRICGDISPYGKRQLQNMIASDLGISKEHQVWI